jgi:hypothetical protein
VTEREQDFISLRDMLSMVSERLGLSPGRAEKFIEDKVIDGFPYSPCAAFFANGIVYDGSMASGVVAEILRYVSAANKIEAFRYECSDEEISDSDYDNYGFKKSTAFSRLGFDDYKSPQRKYPWEEPYQACNWHTGTNGAPSNTRIAGLEAENARLTEECERLKQALASKPRGELAGKLEQSIAEYPARFASIIKTRTITLDGDIRPWLNDLFGWKPGSRHAHVIGQMVAEHFDVDTENGEADTPT